MKWVDLHEVRSFIEKMNIPKIYRPWGYYSILETGDNFKVKLIHVDPGEMTSLQYHLYRTEYWEVLKGEAFITKGDVIFNASSGDLVSIHVKELHRIENKSIQGIQLIEIQVGEILEETDIIRISDKYGR